MQQHGAGPPGALTRLALDFSNISSPVTVVVDAGALFQKQVELDLPTRHGRGARRRPYCTAPTGAAEPRRGAEAERRGPGRYLPDLVVVFPLQGSRVVPARRVRTLLQDVLVADDGFDEEDSLGIYYELKRLRARGSDVTLQEVREALLADLKRHLAKQHCSIRSFRSRDDDELFLLVSLGDPFVRAQDDEVAKTFAHKRRYSFQTNFTAANANEKLKVKQSMRSALEAAYLEYDRDVVEDAVAVFGLFGHEGSDSRSSGMFREYSDGLAGTPGSFMRTVDRVRLLLGSLEQLFDLDDCRGEGLISTYYAAHKASKLLEFRWGQQPSRADFRLGHAPWANFRVCEALRGVLPQCGPPVQEIRDYFGEMTGFYFLWLHFTTVAIVWVLPFAVCFEVLTQVHDKRETLEQKRIIAAVYVGSAVCLSVWSQVYIKIWSRRVNHYRELWGASHLDMDDAKRPNYRGDPKPNPVNENVLTKVHNPWFRRGVAGVAVSVTTLFVGIVVATVLWIYGHQDQLGEFVTSVLLSAQIFICQIVWNYVSIKLVDVLNPRTDNAAKNLHVQVLFPFSLVSAYANIFMKWGHSSSCWDVREADCTRPMRVSLYQVVLPVLFAQIPSMLAPYAIYRLKLWKEAMKLRRSRGKDVRIGFLEAQAKQPPFRALDHLNSEMNQMAVLLGYVMLFGCVAPGISVAVCLTFLVKIRIDAFKLCNVYQRVMPARCVMDGIGAWDQVLRLLASLGRATSLAIPILNLGYFNSKPEDEPLLRALGAGPSGLTLLQKIVLWFVCKELLDQTGKLIDYFVDDVSHETRLLVKRRRKVTTTMRTMLLSRSIEGEPLAGSSSQRSGPPELDPKARALLQAADAGAQKHLAEQELWSEVDQDADCGHPFRSSGPERKAPVQNAWFR